MSISQLPIITQLIDIFAVVMNLVYDVFNYFNIQNAFVYIITFAIMSRILLIPTSISSHKKIRANAILKPVNDELKERYKKLNKKVFTNKMVFEKFVLLNKYDTGKNSGCMNFFIQFPILVAIYYVVGHLSEFVPEISQMSEEQMFNLYAFNGLDIRETPGTTLLAIFPICTIIIQILHGVTMDLLNKRKIDATNLFSNFLTAYLGFRFPTFLSIYWLAQNVFSFILSLILTLYFNTKDEGYFIENKLNKINKNRAKKGLQPLSEPIDIVEENAEETALCEKELGIKDEDENGTSEETLTECLKEKIEDENLNENISNDDKNSQEENNEELKGESE